MRELSETFLNVDACDINDDHVTAAVMSLVFPEAAEAVNFVEFTKHIELYCNRSSVPLGGILFTNVSRLTN